MRRQSPARSERGTALLAVVFLVTVCAAVAASLLVPALARHGEVETSVDRDRALELAESGLDRGIAAIRRPGGEITANTSEAFTMPGSGSVEVDYLLGSTNGLDDDGDGTVDDADEDEFVEIRSVGVFGSERRGVAVVLRRAVNAGALPAALMLNGTAPILDLQGADYVFDGEEHDLNGDPVGGGTDLPAIVCVSPASDVVSQIAPTAYGQSLGTGGAPPIVSGPAVGLDEWIDQLEMSADTTLTPGIYESGTFGSATFEGVRATFADGDVHLTGTTQGAGLLAVRGDLTITGDSQWTGAIFVSGTIRMTGGGAQSVVGGIVVGQAMEGAAYSATELTAMTATELAAVDAAFAAYDTSMSDVYQWDATSGEWVLVPYTGGGSSENEDDEDDEDGGTPGSGPSITDLAGSAEVLHAPAAIELVLSRLGAVRVLAWREMVAP